MQTFSPSKAKTRYGRLDTATKVCHKTSKNQIQNYEQGHEKYITHKEVKKN